MCTNRSNKFMRSYVGREFSSVRRKMMKEDLGVSKSQAWGCARNPQEIFKETQASKLGDAPMHPLLHQRSLVRPSPHYIFITSYVMCYTWSVLHLLFSLFYFACFHNKLKPSLHCLGEKHTPLHHRTQHRFFMLIFVVWTLSFRSYCHV